jgi:hypothetical protein
MEDDADHRKEGGMKGDLMASFSARFPLRSLLPAAPIEVVYCVDDLADHASIHFCQQLQSQRLRWILGGRERSLRAESYLQPVWVSLRTHLHYFGLMAVAVRCRIDSGGVSG